MKLEKEKLQLQLEVLKVKQRMYARIEAEHEAQEAATQGNEENKPTTEADKCE
jgi:hypothetical protein